ncbi:MAG: LysM peptidoglycan-binding domain-containing protein [Chloroflexi bacterium]|nr:LysM peptidoglycan-binding domain-containing protein [Chloroflexota bacterium]
MQKNMISWKSLLFVILLLVLFMLTMPVLAQTPEPTPPDTVLIPLVHTVQDGENLTIIAQNFGVTVEEILAVNGLAADAILFVGQSLIIPGGEGDAVATAYTVQAGDTLAGVAAQFNTSVQSILESNRMVNPNYALTIGQTLTVISRTGSALPQTVQGKLHVVARGESLWLIAARYGLSHSVLMAENGLDVDDLLFPGMRLRIPDEAAYKFLPGEWVDVQIRPLPILQGDTVSIYVENLLDGQPSGSLAGIPLRFFDYEDGYAALVGIDAFTEPGLYTLRLEGSGSRPWRPFQQSFRIQSANYGTQYITVAAALAPLLAPEVRREEDEFLLSIYSQYSDTRYWDDVFQAPVTNTVVTAPYGDGRSYNGGPIEIYHSGIDFSGTIGTPIVAPANGVVVFTGLLELRGQTVVLDHGVGVMSAYFHLSDLFVAEGDTVMAGTLIAAGGSTGLSTGPHLHWDLQINGVSVNGENWLKTTFP